MVKFLGNIKNICTSITAKCENSEAGQEFILHDKVVIFSSKGTSYCWEIL